jgi:hypothetical protein
MDRCALASSAGILERQSWFRWLGIEVKDEGIFYPPSFTETDWHGSDSDWHSMGELPALIQRHQGRLVAL